MAVDERSRHKLHNRLQELLGEEEATTLIDHLPPGGWPNLATKDDIVLLKQDLLQLEERLELRMEAMEYRLKAYVLRTVLLTNVALVSVVIAITRFA